MKVKDATDHSDPAVATRRAAIDAAVDPSRLISTLRNLGGDALDRGVGPRIATRVRRGDVTICDLVIASIWLGRRPAD